MVPTSCLTICASRVDGKGQEQQPEPLPGSVLRGWNGILKESWRNTPRSRPSPQKGVAAPCTHAPALPSTPQVRGLCGPGAGISCLGWNFWFRAVVCCPGLLITSLGVEPAVAAAEKILLWISHRIGIISLISMARVLGKLSPSSCTPRWMKM